MKIADYQIDTAIFFLFGATLVQQFVFFRRKCLPLHLL